MVLLTCSGSSQREICNNGVDDDGNGKTDCDDVDCAGQSTCSADAGYYGNCSKCGQSCTKQSACFGANVLDDRPIAQCTMGKCAVYNQPVQLRIEYDTSNWGGVQPSVLGAVTTRWISKTALDGGAVTCAMVTAAAPANDAPLQLEDAGTFALLGLDVTRVAMVGGSIPNPLRLPFVYVGTGSNYLVFTEAWSGGTDSSTRLPNGTRRPITGCVESGSQIAPVETSQDCNDGGTTCRVLMLPLPRPM
jgi:hypothetical protein